MAYLRQLAAHGLFNQYLEQYNNHQNLVKNLNQEIQLFKLRSDAQQLKTKLQKDKLECQQFDQITYFELLRRMVKTHNVVSNAGNFW
jgi:hypothetical protein